MISWSAPAKINLNLLVTGKRDDGYHTLDSLVVFADVHDRIVVETGDTLSLELSGPFSDGLTGNDDNLVLRAARALQNAAACRQGAAIHLTKSLPLSSGIGGGSADAAATLNALSQLWRIRINKETIDDIALALGADVPVCMAAKAQIMGGIGEQLKNAPIFPALAALLVNPGIAVSTPSVFKALAGRFSKPFNWGQNPLDREQLFALLRQTGNDLMAPAITQHPEIATVLDHLNRLPGCQLARMSGSGATCFALFNNATEANAAATELKARQSGWWITPTRLNAQA